MTLINILAVIGAITVVVFAILVLLLALNKFRGWRYNRGEEERMQLRKEKYEERRRKELEEKSC